jgi:hypothetical protein
VVKKFSSTSSNLRGAEKRPFLTIMIDKDDSKLYFRDSVFKVQ